MLRPSRRRVPALAAAALILAACQGAAPPASPQPSPGMDEPMVLVVTEAASGTYEQSGAVHRLTLSDVDPEMTWFDDRPFRNAGHVPLQQGLDVLYSDEADGPPNAALAVENPDGGPDLVVVLELTDPQYDASGEGTLTFTATPLEQPTTGLDYYAGRTTDAFPASFGPASLFIDTIFGYNYCGAQIQNNGTTVLELESSSGNWDSDPPTQIAGGTLASFEAKSSWASTCNMNVSYTQQGGSSGFYLYVQSPAVGSNNMGIENAGSGACNAQGQIESTGGSTATALVTVDCPPLSTPTGTP